MASAARPSRPAPSRATRRGSWFIGPVPSSWPHRFSTRNPGGFKRPLELCPVVMPISSQAVDRLETQPRQRASGGVGAAHPVRSRPGRCRGGAEVRARDAGEVRVDRESRSEQELGQRGCAADDVTTDIVRVVHRHLRRRAHRHADDPLAEAGGESLDLGDHRLGGIAGVGVRHVGVRPQRVDVADRPGRVGEVLLADEHERSYGHRPPMHRFLSCRRPHRGFHRDGPCRRGGPREPSTGHHPRSRSRP